jgi:hypothetical protein
MPDTQVRAYDGRGGDGGRDVVVRQGSRVRIFQLKYFRDGFGAERRSRRTQIRRSFGTAMQHRPYEWVLVIPTNPTQGEEDFVRGLGADHPDVKIRIMGRKELDSRLGTYPDLVDYFTRDQLREAASVYNQEQAMLYGGLPDLTDRLRGLSRVVDSVDPDWAVESVMRHGTIEHRLRPKHRRAAEVSPISLKITAAFGPEHKDLAAAFRRTFGFSTGEPLTLPPETIRDLTFTGPSWLTAPEGPVEVTWIPDRPLPEASSTAQIHLIAADNRRLSSHQGTVRHAGSGFLGYSAELDFYGCASLSLLIGHDNASQLNGKFSLTEAAPTATLQTACLFRDLQNSHHLDLELDGQHAGRLTRLDPSGLDEQTAKNLAITELLASDLELVQRHCRTFFPVPAELSVNDRIAIRVARLLIEGHCVVHPTTRAFTATLNGRNGPDLQRVLRTRGPVPMRIDTDMTIQVAGWDLALGEAQIFHTQVEIPNRAELLSAFERGQAAGKTMMLVPIDGQSYRAFLPSKWRGRDDETLHVTGWGLPGLNGPQRG